MIVNRHESWLKMIFSFRGTSLSETTPRIICFTLWAVLVTVVEEWTQTYVYTLSSTPFTLIGLALGIFLGFRNNAAYARYWEARTLLGRLVNASRSWARQVNMMIDAPEGQQAREAEELRRDLVIRVIGYVHALKHALRNQDPFEEIAQFFPAEEIEQLRFQKNVPAAIQHDLGIRLRHAWKRGWLTDYHYNTLEAALTEFTGIQGGCERIKNTPIPYAYTVLIHRTVAFYCFFLPFGIVQDAHLLTPLVVLLIAHAFFGLDEVGDEIEEPFGTDPQDLPVAALSTMIEVNLKQQLGDTDLPELHQPVNDVLL